MQLSLGKHDNACSFFVYILIFVCQKFLLSLPPPSHKLPLLSHKPVPTLHVRVLFGLHGHCARRLFCRYWSNNTFCPIFIAQWRLFNININTHINGIHNTMLCIYIYRYIILHMCTYIKRDLHAPSGVNDRGAPSPRLCEMYRYYPIIIQIYNIYTCQGRNIPQNASIHWVYNFYICNL